MNRILTLAIASLTLIAPAALAAQSESGTILVPAAATSWSWVVGGSNDGITNTLYANTGVEFNGLDGWIIPLDEGLANFDLSGDPGILGVCDMDIYFYDANGGSLDYPNAGTDVGAIECGEGAGRASSDTDEIPAGASVAVISLYLGFNVNFTFEAE